MSEADVVVQTHSSIASPANRKSVDKAIVAVHGIGDQFNYATIQAVVNQFCEYHNEPAAVPLGTFHNGTGVVTLDPPLCGYLFAEVYWAKIPRALAEEKHTLEEARAWARTIVGRLKVRWKEHQRQGCQEHDFHLLEQVLCEMTDSIHVLDRICLLANKAGIFTCDLRKVLDDYLGDVQVVAEFTEEREKIIATFMKTMADTHKVSPDAEIYIVAHSEGTVVALLGLLQACRENTRPEWLDSVRGLMTLGSPIDKHFVLWPALFGSTSPQHVPATQIEWHNYYDVGDPIGFDLDDIRRWLRHQPADGGSRWDTVFHFTGAQDHGFSRYAFPAKAHVDYWTDKHIFKHFIENVVCRDRHEKPPSPPPASRPGLQFSSYFVPYAAVFAVLSTGAFILLKALLGALEPNHTPSIREIATGVLPIAMLLFGITVASRVPRLTRNIGCRFAAVAIGTLCVAGYVAALVQPGNVVLFGTVVPATFVIASMVLALVGAAYGISALRPMWGIKPLVFGGILAVAGVVAWHLSQAHGQNGPIWPVILALCALLYLWWLAALLFDLTFVWHWYIRHSRVLMRMDEITVGARSEAARRQERPIPGSVMVGPAPRKPAL